MKRLNRNGFAISTMLYGLLIVMVLLMSLLMSTISFARSNSKNFVSNVISDLEYRDLTPPTVTLTTNNTIQKMLYTQTAQELSLSFQISDDSALDLKPSYFTNFYIGNQQFNSSCDARNFSNDMKTATIDCKIVIPESNTATGILSIDFPKILDIYGNSSSVVKHKTGYEFKVDDIAPTFELLSSKSGQYYFRDLTDNFVKVKLCDNAPGDITPVSDEKKRDVRIKIGNHDQNSKLQEIRSENNCRIFSIGETLNSLSEGKMEITIPGKEDGDRYGWKDKHGNISNRTTLSTDITFVSENKVALQLEKFEKTMLNTGKEYTLEGNINIMSLKCASQKLHRIIDPISPTCRIGDKTVRCELDSNIESKKLIYKIKVNSSNKETGRVSITIPEHVIEDCMGNHNDRITIYLGSEFVAP